MKHLTNEEIMNFVSFDAITPESLQLASRVNSHILRCSECREKVREYQKLYDENALPQPAAEHFVWQSESAPGKSAAGNR